MDREKIRRTLNPGLSLEQVDKEIEMRYKTRNLFRPNAGSPVKKRQQQPVVQPKIQSAQQIPPSVQPDLDSGIQTPIIIKEPSLEERVALRTSTPYVKGDNIFLELLTYFHANKLGNQNIVPVLEEDANCLLATVAAASRLSLLIEGKSRSGKSLILDKLAELLPSVYCLKVCSNKSVFGRAEDINNNEFLYISEFQSAVEGNPAVKEAIKLITENKDATNDSGNNTQTLSGHLTVLSTGADENVRTQKRDVEVSGRFILLHTLSNPEKTKRICAYQDGLLMGIIPDVEYAPERLARLQSHIAATLNDKTTSFENPFANTYAEHLPETQKSVYYRTLYYSLINGFTKFDSPNRVRKGDKLITGIADMHLVHMLYHASYCDALKKLTVQSSQALEKVLDDTQQECERELSLIEQARNYQPDWKNIWQAALGHMETHNPKLVKEWVASQVKDGKVTVYNPLEKKDIYICDHA